MSEHGGAREGSGRKSKKKLFNDLSLAKKRKLVMGFITEEQVQKIVENMVERALIDGKEAQYLINQFIGKPLQATDITSGGEKIESFNDEQVERIAQRIANKRASNGGTSS